MTKYSESMTVAEVENHLNRITNDYSVSYSEARDMFIGMEMDI